MKREPEEALFGPRRSTTADARVDVEERSREKRVRLEIDDSNSALLFEHEEPGVITGHMSDRDGTRHAIRNASGVDGLCVHLASGCKDESETAEEILE